MGALFAAVLNPGTWMIAAIVALVMGGTGWWQGHSGKAEAVAVAEKAARTEGFNEATDLAFAQFAKDQAVVRKQLAKANASRLTAESTIRQLEAYRASNPPSYAAACDLDDERMRILTEAVTGRPSDAGGVRAAVPPAGAAPGPKPIGLRPHDGGELTPSQGLRRPSRLDARVPEAVPLQ